MNPYQIAAWRNRTLSLFTVTAYVTLTHTLIDDPLWRSKISYAVVITLGYGHLIGGAFFAGGHTKSKFDQIINQISKRPNRFGKWLRKLPLQTQQRLGLFSFTALAGLLYLIYISLLSEKPFIALPLLAISTWHSVENDFSLEATYRGHLRTPTFSWQFDPQLISFGWTACLLGWAAHSLMDPLSEEGPLSLSLRVMVALSGAVFILRYSDATSQWIGIALIAASSLSPNWILLQGSLKFSDLFVISVLYHLVSWGILSAERCLRKNGPPQMGQKLALVHLVPLGLLIGSLASPEPWGTELRSSFLSPVAYLFWSVIHVFQTLWLRTGQRKITQKAPRTL